MTTVFLTRRWLQCSLLEDDYSVRLLEDDYRVPLLEDDYSVPLLEDDYSVEDGDQQVGQ